VSAQIPPAIAAEVERLAAAHLARHPADRRYVALLLENREYAPTDGKYLAWLRYNLNGIDAGARLLGRLEAAAGALAGCRALDVGAGGGGNSLALARHGCAVTAVEIDPLRLGWLRTRVADHDAPIRVEDRPLEAQPADERYDLVICNAVLEHVEDWQAFLDALLARCPTGTIYLAWPNRWSLLEIWADQHYGLLGGVFLTGRLRALQKPYLRLRGITRDAWVVAVPSVGAVRSHLDRRVKFALDDLPPDGFEKLRDPARINHAGARRVLRALTALGIGSDRLGQLIASQKHTRELVIRTGGPRRA
jgi:2-polyprenyl-3-methyl-5-hydroxy-6-metoxy-1,4-benzoquinol methylase